MPPLAIGEELPSNWTITRSAVSEGRLVSIDAMRGVAALAVVLFHALGQQPYVFTPSLGGRIAALVLRSGMLGVYLFFVISGFCIHLRWAKQRSAGLAPAIDFAVFWKRRFLRLYPAYVVSLGLYILVQWLAGSIRFDGFFLVDVASHLVMLHNLHPATTFSLNGVFWTLAVEEQLYLLYFVFLALRTRYGWPKTLALTLVARVVWFLAAFAIHGRFGVGITVLESAAAGWFVWVLGALAVEAAVGIVTLPRWCFNWLAGAAILVAAFLVNQLDAVRSAQGAVHKIVLMWSQPLWGIAFFMIANATVRRDAQRGRPGAIGLSCARLGLFSYSLYLTHELIITHLGNLLARAFGWSADVQTTMSLLVLTAVSIGFARVFFVAFERPFMTRAVPLRLQLAAA